METVQDIVQTVLLIAAGVLGISLTLALSLIAFALADKAKGWASKVDANPAVLAFGNSPLGQAANQYFNQLLSRVDEPSDPIIQAIHNMQALRTLKSAGLVSPELFSHLLAQAVQTGIKLTDGIPDVEFTVKQ